MKLNKTYRFSEQTIERLETLSKLWEIPQTGVVEQLVKKAAVEAGIEKGASKKLEQILKS